MKRKERIIWILILIFLCYWLSYLALQIAELKKIPNLELHLEGQGPYRHQYLESAE